MAVEILMPRLGWTMEEGTLVEWHKQDGDVVQPGDIMFIVESDKALNEVECFESGIFRIPPDSDIRGKLVPVGTLLAYIVQPGEVAPFEKTGTSVPVTNTMLKNTTVPPTTTSTIVKAASNGVNKNQTLPTISPRARRVAGELGVEWENLHGSGRTGRIVERDVRAAAALEVSAQISPVAKRAADDLGVDVATLASRMPGQRITREHVERAAAQQAISPPPTTPRNEIRIPLPRLRQVIAERMTTSAHTTAAVTLTSEVDATELVKIRKGLKDTGKSDTRPTPSYNDLLAKLAATALADHPYVNARIDGDEIITSSAIHIGFAVDTERGLLVPVIRDVQTKSIRQIAAESIVLVEQAKRGSLSPDDLNSGTFTITNLGMYDIDTFTPIINLPQCAILGVGRIVPKQVVIDTEAERVAIRHMMFLSLTFDHRLVDGAPAARFLQQVKHFIEKPYMWLVN